MSPKSQISSHRHHKQADANEELARELVNRAPEWSVTLAFYAALHSVDELAAYQQTGFACHDERNDWVYSSPELGLVRRAWYQLYAWSRIARYDCPGQANDVRKPDWVSTNAFAYMDRIRRRVEAAKEEHAGQDQV